MIINRRVGGGGGFTPPTAQFTLAEEMTVTEAVNAAAFSVKYARCMIVMKITGTNVQINGTNTPRTIIIHVQGAGPYDGSYQCSYRSGGPYAPNNCAFSQNNWYSYASNTYVSISNANILSISIGGNLYIAAGNTIEFIEIPYNWSTMTFDLTERA